MCPEGARVFLVYAAPGGRTLLDRELYLPQEWAQDAARRAEAGVPEAVTLHTKPALARAMLERAFRADVPAAWVTGDEVYGRDRRVRLWLEEQERPFVLAVPTSASLWVQNARGPLQRAAAAITAALAPEAWVARPAGDGTRGPRIDAWARVRLARWPVPGWEHWLLARRRRADPTDLAYDVVFAPAGTTLTTLVRVAGTRWAVEECFRIAKNEVGLADYEFRRWDGWYRHITVALLTQAFPTVVRARVVGMQKGGVRPCSPPSSSR